MNFKKNNFIKIIVLGFWTLFIGYNGFAQGHPSLVLTKKGVQEIKSRLGKVPLFDASVEEIKNEVDAEIAVGIQVPIPKDFSGGYTHERHKKNFLIAQKAGVLYQILADKKYAIYVRDMLMAYAKLYPNLPLHPQERSYARGKLFWQALNDSNWLVYMSQAYDCVYDFIGAQDRIVLEKELFKPFADFISVGSPQFFNRVHNHSTWGNVAVGMIALVMDDSVLLDRALHGLKDDGLAIGLKDNDGGLIKKEGQKTGFLANVDEPFSPDGYYNEGPYYQRYAMYPFMVFAEALQNTKPELKIFDYKDGILIKSVYALLNLTNSAGEFFPLNDGQKGMSYYSRELVSAVDIAYLFGGRDAALLSIAEKQGRVQLDNSGMAVALAIKNKLSKPFEKKSIDLSDGSTGQDGGVAILRNRVADTEMTLVMKYAAQGSSHGHFDKLSFSYYNNSSEVLQDYGLARFVNIEQKGGGNYLKENGTWAKQTIAHNTIVQNEKSHFDGDFEKGNLHSSKQYLFDVNDSKVQVISATDENAYPGTKMHRTMVVLEAEGYEKPLLLDIFQVDSDTANQYDLPFYYMGQMMSANFKYETPKTLEPLGKADGYEHLWKEGVGEAGANNTKFSWLSEGKFYTLTTATQAEDEVLLVRLGANDPNFNLRRDAGIIIRKKNTKKATFVNVIETHGTYSPVTENAINASSSIANVSIAFEDQDYVAVSITGKNGVTDLFIIATKDNSKDKIHNLMVNGTNYSWTGSKYNTIIK
tara:strand:- start:1554 stop:3818 length:2265 start_codon:yes stop_codon:yes gene_type:complete